MVHLKAYSHAVAQLVVALSERSEVAPCGAELLCEKSNSD